MKSELALFAGGGGGLLGSHLADYRTIAAVEIDPYCRELLLRRQADGLLPLFPIWDDVRTFDGRPFRGLVDLLSAGFPCQRFSTASRGRKVAADLWDEVVRIAEEIRPRTILVENVLEEAFPDGVPAIEACPSSYGAPHRRPRFWLVADADDESEPDESFDEEMARLRPPAGLDWWRTLPAVVLGMDDGRSSRMDRTRALGNGQVPAVVRELLRR